MTPRIFHACRQVVSEEHGRAPQSFLDQIIDTINELDDGVFAENDRNDIYSVMVDTLGPYRGIRHRRAVMCEVLRVQAAFESDWNWNEGVDTKNRRSMTHKQAEETGAFQVSFDSMSTDPSLKACLVRRTGNSDVDTFITKMKSDHALAIEYCVRLLRFDTTWCGTIKNDNQVIAHVKKEAVEEFVTFMKNS